MARMIAPPQTEPAWPENPDPGRFHYVYDRLSDTLFVHFYGEALPASSEPIDMGGNRDYAFARVDPLSNEVVGLQIESFLSYAVEQRPEFLGALEEAELHGYDDIEAANIRRRAREQRQGPSNPDALANAFRLGA